MNTDNIIYFWRPYESYGQFSNWSNHPITENGITFKTAEHYIMYRKAKCMNDESILNQIIDAKTPDLAKKLGRKVKNWDEAKWTEHREKIMFDTLLLKVNQNTEVKDLLIKTGDSIIAEASPYDSIWGTGVSKENSKGPESWKGLNLLGKTWTKVRATITLNPLG